MRKLVIGMAMASTALTTPAMARDGQWYIQGDGGVMIVQDQSLDVNGVADNAKADYDTGYDFGGLVGYDFGGFRLEAEASYRAADLTQVVAGNQGLALNPSAGAPGGFTRFTGTRDALGEVNALSFMLNGLVDFGDDDSLQGFVGGGVGVARVDLDGRVNSNGPGVWNDSDTGFAWQLLAGVRAPLSDSWDVGLKYRYFRAEDVNLVDALGRTLDTKMTSHSLLGSITYNFGGEEPVVAPAAVTPPPPPKAPCNTGPYIVFFDFDKSDITSEAAGILNSAVTAYANCGTASVMLAGHTDRSGSTKYNEGLADRRNKAVTAYLTGRGIPAARITGQSFGETKPRVPTADGVREAQNRRVEVTYGPGSGM
ncbi:OmpA family protein [Erythrobacter sp. CCH5-A1]|uniref:OmpA family protein n=1 Tax=Erythrobacter sp. CCH5-A1 TaxID=1768792 RepID=UPI0008378AE5|nr:OmpA family protein [Erythrobacter sp. CCH5-A1]